VSARSIALIVVDVQRGFDDAAYWGPRNNPGCERHVEQLIAAWRAHRQPVVFVRHDSTNADSPLAPGGAGNAFKACITGVPDLLVAKQVNSCFYGTPDLHAWLRAGGIERIAICGITTNHCCETTARMAGNLGYETFFALDATHAFDRTGPDGVELSGDELARATATNLHGEFATVIDTAALLALLDSNAT
jgi:nicotinamidase-related amidase